MKKSDFWLYLLVLVVLASGLFFWKITRIPISDGDTFYYISIAKNILATGNWLDLKAPGAIVPKPPLVVWFMAASFKTFGVNLLGVNFWHLKTAVWVVVLTFLLGYFMFNLRTGLLSGLVLTTAALFFYQARSPLLDIPLMFFINLSFLFFWLFYKYEKITFFYLFELAVGLALLVKGLIGPFLILLVVAPFAWFFCRRHFQKNLNRHFLISSGLILALFLVWFVRELLIIGPPFLKMLFVENVVRFFHPIDGPTRAAQFDFYSYFLYLVVCFIPWTGLAFSGFWYFWKNRRVGLPAAAWDNHLEARQFVFWWFVLIFVFFSISGHYKIPRYILPVFPALALMVGYLFDRALLGAEDFKKYFWSGAALTWLIVTPGAVAGYFWLQTQFPSEIMEYHPMFLTFIFMFLGGLTLAAFLAFLKNQKTRALAVFAAFFLVAYGSYFYLLNSAEKYYNKLVPYLQIARSLKNENIDRYAAWNLKEGAQDLSFYLGKDLTILNNEDELKKFLAAPGRPLVFTSGKNPGGPNFFQIEKQI